MSAFVQCCRFLGESGASGRERATEGREVLASWTAGGGLLLCPGTSRLHVNPSSKRIYVQ